MNALESPEVEVLKDAFVTLDHSFQTAWAGVNKLQEVNMAIFLLHKQITANGPLTQGKYTYTAVFSKEGNFGIKRIPKDFAADPNEFEQFMARISAAQAVKALANATYASSNSFRDKPIYSTRPDMGLANNAPDYPGI